jgi:hypothetical protein
MNLTAEIEALIQSKRLDIRHKEKVKEIKLEILREKYKKYV